MKREELRKKRVVTLYKKVPPGYRQKYMYVTESEKKTVKKGNNKKGIMASNKAGVQKGAPTVINSNKNAVNDGSSSIWKLRPIDLDSKHDVDYDEIWRKLVRRGVVGPNINGGFVMNRLSVNNSETADSWT